MLCFDKEVAQELGVNAAVVLQQLHYWTSKGYGRTFKGRVYIYNTYEQWQEQLSFMSVMTLRRVFKKLVEIEAVFSYRKGYDRTSHWSLNYSHPMCSFCTNGSVQNEQMDVIKMNSSVHTLTINNNKDLPHVSFSKQLLPTTKPTTKLTRSYRDDFKVANEWLEVQTKDFKDQVNEYTDFHCNSPTTKYPHALKMKIVVEIWKKYTDQQNHTDFQYINKEEFKPSTRSAIVFEKQKFYEGVDDEMQTLYLQGEVE